MNTKPGRGAAPRRAGPHMRRAALICAWRMDAETGRLVCRWRIAREAAPEPNPRAR
jgi:hypothetical protein